MKKSKIDYKPLFEKYAKHELTATQIANTYDINRSSFIQCYKRYLAKIIPSINNKKLAGLDLSADELKGTAYEIAFKALAKIDLMLDEIITPSDYAELMKAFKAICDSIGLSRQIPQIAIQNNFSNVTNEPNPLEIKVNFLTKIIKAQSPNQPFFQP